MTGFRVPQVEAGNLADLGPPSGDFSEQSAEALDAGIPAMSPAEQLFAARVALYGPDLAAEVTEFYGTLKYGFRSVLAHINDPGERNRQAEMLAEEAAQRMDQSRGQGYLKHPAHKSQADRRF